MSKPPTKTTKQLREENEQMREIIRELHWMARRYADGRRSTAPWGFNHATRKCLELGIKLNSGSEGIIWARDDMGRSFDGLSAEEATPGTPAALGGGVMKPLRFRYRNHRGEVAVRTVQLGYILWIATDHHPEPQWIMRAWDIDRQAERYFAMTDILEFLREAVR